MAERSYLPYEVQLLALAALPEDQRAARMQEILDEMETRTPTFEEDARRAEAANTQARQATEQSRRRLE